VEDRITQCTAEIVKALDSVQEINILSLSEYIGESSVLTYQALGWLAREGRIRYRQKGKQVLVSLQESETEGPGQPE
jgi:hypothetical protein